MIYIHDDTDDDTNDDTDDDIDDDTDDDDSSTLSSTVANLHAIDAYFTLQIFNPNCGLFLYSAVNQMCMQVCIYDDHEDDYDIGAVE